MMISSTNHSGTVQFVFVTTQSYSLYQYLGFNMFPPKVFLVSIFTFLCPFDLDVSMNSSSSSPVLWRDEVLMARSLLLTEPDWELADLLRLFNSFNSGVDSRVLWIVNSKCQLKHLYSLYLAYHFITHEHYMWVSNFKIHMLYPSLFSINKTQVI